MKKLLCICGCSKRKRNTKKSSTIQTEATELKESIKTKRMDSFEQKKREQNTKKQENTPRQIKDQELKETKTQTEQTNKASTPSQWEDKSNSNNHQPEQKIELIISNEKDKDPELNNNESSAVIKAIESNIPVTQNKEKTEEEIILKIENKPLMIPMIRKEAEEEDEGEKWLIPKDSKLILPYERDVIEFSPNGLGRFLETLDNLTYAPLYNKNNLEINIRREGSPLNSTFFLFRSVYTQRKSELGENANVPNIVRLMYRIEDRVKWDTTLKLVKKYEGDEKVFVVRTWCHSVVFFISEREGLEKRMMFTYKGVPIVLSTSVSDDVINNYLNYNVVYS